MSGWVKLHRSIRDWEWYTDSNTVHLFVHMLILASHKETRYRGEVITPGSFVSGRERLSAETGISQQKVRTIINRLKSTNELTIKSTSKYSVFTLVNWAKYQSEEKDQPANQPANQPAINQQSTSNQPAINHNQEVKKVKKVKNEENKPLRRFTPPTKEDVKAYCTERENSIDPEQFVDYYSARGWMLGRSKMRDWKAAVKTWEKNDYGSGANGNEKRVDRSRDESVYDGYVTGEKLC